MTSVAKVNLSELQNGIVGEYGNFINFFVRFSRYSIGYVDTC